VAKHLQGIKVSGDYLRHGMQRAFKKAKLLRALFLLAGLLIVLLPFFLKSQVTIEVSLLILFFVRGGQFLLNVGCRSWISTGRRYHQQNLFFDGLGERPSPGTIQEIVRDFGEPTPSASPYFASTEPAGPLRLIGNTAESAFFTASYAGIYKFIVLLPIVTLLSYMTFILFIGNNHTQDEQGLKLILALAGFFLFGDVANRFLELHAIEEKCDQIAKEGLKIMADLNTEIDIKTAKDYSFKYILSLGSALPLPNWLHWWKNSSTTKAWLAGLKVS